MSERKLGVGLIGSFRWAERPICRAMPPTRA
jgi:hypothetical protein